MIPEFSKPGAKRVRFSFLVPRESFELAYPCGMTLVVLDERGEPQKRYYLCSRLLAHYAKIVPTPSKPCAAAVTMLSRRCSRCGDYHFFRTLSVLSIKLQAGRLLDQNDVEAIVLRTHPLHDRPCNAPIPAAPAVSPDKKKRTTTTKKKKLPPPATKTWKKKTKIVSMEAKRTAVSDPVYAYAFGKDE